jgi:hypothetical protein
MKRKMSEEELFLKERYGKRYADSLGWRLPAAIVALIGIPWLLWSAGYHSQPSIRHELIAFKVIDSSKIEITYLVERSEADIRVFCTLVARDFEKNVVGEARDEFEANDQPSREVRTRLILTRTRAVNAGIIGCDRL